MTPSLDADVTLTASLSDNMVTISWTPSEGTLEEADDVTGPWNASANQDNPQTITGTDARKFYRVVGQ